MSLTDLFVPRTIRDALSFAHQLIKDLERFSTGANARDANGEVVLSSSKRACRFCANGAIYKVSGDNRAVAEGAIDLLNYATYCLYQERQAHRINDGMDGHARILAAFTFAIALAPETIL